MIFSEILYEVSSDHTENRVRIEEEELINHFRRVTAVPSQNHTAPITHCIRNSQRPALCNQQMLYVLLPPRFNPVKHDTRRF